MSTFYLGRYFSVPEVTYLTVSFSVASPVVSSRLLNQAPGVVWVAGNVEQRPCSLSSALSTWTHWPRSSLELRVGGKLTIWRLGPEVYASSRRRLVLEKLKSARAAVSQLPLDPGWSCGKYLQSVSCVACALNNFLLLPIWKSREMNLLSRCCVLVPCRTEVNVIDSGLWRSDQRKQSNYAAHAKNNARHRIFWAD